ncbi:hypothetical protein C8J56DRAFT_946464 [Mycena floridula]|nr:hypothetical protein C8J56DRAFT_946464 [Mycena floridula]
MLPSKIHRLTSLLLAVILSQDVLAAPAIVADKNALLLPRGPELEVRTLELESRVWPKIRKPKLPPKKQPPPPDPNKSYVCRTCGTRYTTALERLHCPKCTKPQYNPGQPSPAYPSNTDEWRDPPPRSSREELPPYSATDPNANGGGSSSRGGGGGGGAGTSSRSSGRHRSERSSRH